MKWAVLVLIETHGAGGGKPALSAVPGFTNKRLANAAAKAIFEAIQDDYRNVLTMAVQLDGEPDGVGAGHRERQVTPREEPP